MCDYDTPVYMEIIGFHRFLANRVRRTWTVLLIERNGCSRSNFHY